MKWCIVLFFIGYSWGLTGQDSAQILILPDAEQLYIHGWKYQEAAIRDSSILTVIYQFKYMYDTKNSRTRTNKVKLEIGHSYSRYYSLIWELIDSTNFAKQNNATLGIPIMAELSDAEKSARSDAGDVNLHGEIWIDYKKEQLTERFRSNSNYNTATQYQESCSTFKWQLLSDTATMCGYHCMKATALFRGRQWYVWYTTQIPTFVNLWKFNGLPGLIMCAEDKNREYIWECIGILQHKNPIRYYQPHTITTTRKQWLRYLKTLHEQPLATLRGHTGSFRVLSQGKWLDESWTIPYNLIELE